MGIAKKINYYSEYLREEIVWDIGVCKKGEWLFLKTTPRFWNADPFLFSYNDKLYLFYEKYDRKKFRGQICCREVLDNCFGPEFSLINDKFHYSFPYVFQLNGSIFMIPETSEKRTLEVYKMISFPDKWELYKTIRNNVSFADTILYSFNDESLCLLTSDTSNSPCNVQNLFVWCSLDFDFIKESLSKNASFYGNRNAGKIECVNDKRFRYGQDCSNNQYGVGIIKYCILDDSEQEVSYFSVSSFLNHSEYIGVHTYNIEKDAFTIDLKRVIKRSLFQRIRLLVKLIKKYVRRRIKH